MDLQEGDAQWYQLLFASIHSLFEDLHVYTYSWWVITTHLKTESTRQIRSFPQERMA